MKFIITKASSKFAKLTNLRKPMLLSPLRSYARKERSGLSILGLRR